MLCNVASGLLAAYLSGFYEAELQRVVALALFIPVVLALAESVSIQSVSLALQALHGGQLNLVSIWRKGKVEALVGMLLGLGCGALVSLAALVWLGERGVALSLAAGICGGMTAAAVIGLCMPMLLRLARLDPQIAAGPIALAAADVVTLLLYFNLARWLV